MKMSVELPAGTSLRIQTIEDRIRIEWDDTSLVPFVTDVVRVPHPPADAGVDLPPTDPHWAMLCRTCGGSRGDPA